MHRLRLILAALAVALGLARPASAHQVGLSYASVGADSFTLQISSAELADQLPLDEDLAASRDLLTGLILDRVELSRGGAPCTLDTPAVRRVPPAPGALDNIDGIELAAPMRCEAQGETVYRVGFFSSLATGHRHYVDADGQPVAVLDAAHPEARFQGAAAPGQVASRFVALGVEHIWTGYDHLLFLLALLVTATSLRAMLLIVTGFTVAHSITLSLAALGALSLSPSLVEPAIAATIAFVGVENLWRPTARRRVVLTFFLGLIHGFGFAGVLAEAGLPPDALALALVCFNGGVELGQAVLVAVTLPLLLWLRRFDVWERRVVPAVSIGVALAGVYWLVERTLG